MEKYLFLLSYLSEPCNRTSMRESSFKFFQLRHLADKHHHGAFVFHLQKIANTRKSDWSFLFQHHNDTWDSHSLWNYDEIMYSLRWLNCNWSLVSNVTLTGSCIENNDLCFREKKLISIDLNCLIDSASRMVLPYLFHFLTQKGKKECLKLSVLQENSGKLFLFPDLVW